MSTTRFGSNVAWNMASLAFLAAAGLLLNIVIGRIYGPRALGLFNIVFALYIFFSQFGALGVHFSVLRYVSEYAGRRQADLDGAVAGGLMLAAVVSSLVAALALVSTPLVGHFYRVEGVATAWLALLPGLWCFPINKVLLSVVNGAQHMRAFALFQALRYALILLGLACLVLMGARPELLPAVLTIAEVGLLPPLLWYVRAIVTRWDWAGGRGWTGRHISFGLRGFLSGTIGELNTRVDVLMIGAMLDEKRAGIYSVALLLAEGLAQAIVVVRGNLNPMLTRMIGDGKVDELAAFGRRVSGLFTLFMAAAGLILVVGFAGAVELLFSSSDFDGARVPLAILVLGLVLASPYMPFGMIFAQTGRPGLQTAFAAAVLGANVLLNLVLIPIVGIDGAAVGTALSYLITAGLLLMTMRRLYNLRIWF